MNALFVRHNRQPRSGRFSRIDPELMLPVGAFTVFLLLAGCSNRGNAVSGTIEVDEAHVGPRSGGRVEKILAQEGDRLHEGQVIVQLDASELRARRDLASAQIDTAVHDADAQEAQLVFLRDEAHRQQDLLQRRVVSATDAERADSAAKTQEKNVAAAKMRVAQARAQLGYRFAAGGDAGGCAGRFDSRGAECQSGRRTTRESRSCHAASDGTSLGARLCP